MKIDVRCCCNPALVIGTLEFSFDAKQRESVVVFLKAPPVRYPGAGQCRYWVREKVVLKVRDWAEYRYGATLCDRAIDSHDHPVEWWRRVIGFEEANPQ